RSIGPFANDMHLELYRPVIRNRQQLNCLADIWKRIHLCCLVSVDAHGYSIGPVGYFSCPYLWGQQNSAELRAGMMDAAAEYLLQTERIHSSSQAEASP